MWGNQPFVYISHLINRGSICTEHVGMHTALNVNERMPPSEMIPGIIGNGENLKHSSIINPTSLKDNHFVFGGISR